MSDFNTNIPSLALGIGVGTVVGIALHAILSGGDSEERLKGLEVGLARMEQSASASEARIKELNDQVANLNSKTLTKEDSARVIVQKIRQELHVSRDRLQVIVEHMVKEMERGLAKDGATLRMIPSFVTRRATGSETGTFLALDLGGSNFRVCEAKFDGNRYAPRLDSKAFRIPNETKTGTAEELFDFIAASILEFLEGRGEDKSSKISLGFTFSFPVQQTAVNSGSLLQWSKGFTASGAIGKDVVVLLQAALQRQGANCNVTSLINDTVGTLLAAGYEEPATVMGVILGTGTNAAYYEKISAIPKLAGQKFDGDEMVINMEWGAFDREKKILPVSKYDDTLDHQSNNPGEQVFEKMISGMYLGEVVRQIVVDLACKEGILFGGQCSRHMQTPYSFETSMMGRCERDHSAELLDVDALLSEVFGLTDITYSDRVVVKEVCEAVAIRAARLSAAGIAAVLNKSGAFSEGVQHVAIDGSVFEKYPHFKSRMGDAMVELFGMGAQNIEMNLAQDGSGVGAAVTAALYADEQH